MFLGGQTTEFYMHDHLPFLPVASYSTAWFQLSDCSLISQATPFADRSVGRTENCWKTRSFALFAAISYYVATCHHASLVPRPFLYWAGGERGEGRKGLGTKLSPRCVRAMGVCRALTLFGDAKQAMGEGKSGPVETGLTGPVATVLLTCK